MLLHIIISIIGRCLKEMINGVCFILGEQALDGEEKESSYQCLSLTA